MMTTAHVDFTKIEQVMVAIATRIAGFVIQISFFA